jgi:zinc protease
MRLSIPFTAAILLLTGLVATDAPGQPAPAASVSQTFDDRALLPFDPAVRRATLPNGFTYYIRQNGRPARRVSLRLAVKAGSLHEADDQQGLAHFLEHMAFNGTEHFPPGELVSFFERTGARLGPHVNAYTSFDETVYMLDLPTDDPAVVAKGLLAMADVAGGLTLDPVQVDKERGVVIEEWRGRLGAGSRIRDQQIPVLYHGSRYADRLPIGKPEILRTAPTERLRAFYDAWYRPERMALIVVGDVETAAMERAIHSSFEGLKARGTAAAAPDTTVPLHADLLLNVAADPEMTRSSITLVRKRPRDVEDRVGHYRRHLTQRLLELVVNERFDELGRRPDARFLRAGADAGGLSPDIATFTLRASVEDGRIAGALSALAIEAARLREHGVTASEVDRARKWLAASYERAYTERDKSESQSFAQEYLSHFLEQEPAPGIEFENRLAQQALPGITPADVTALARELLGPDGRVVLAVSPRKSGVQVPTEADLRTALSSAEAVAVTAWSDTTTGSSLMEETPAPGSVESTRQIAGLGVTVVRFANGVEAWLKPTDFKNDQVLFTLYGQGGSSLAGEEDMAGASLSPGYVNLSGIGGMKALDLQRRLAGRFASATPFIGRSTHGISGSASPADFETALQLLYHGFTAPGDDPEAFALMKRQLESRVANRGQDPEQVFGERVEQINSSRHFTSEPLTTERVAALDRGKMLAYYRARFSNAADFTMFVVGAFDIETTVPLLARYVGSLPSTGKRSSRFKDLGIRFPAKVERERITLGREPRSRAIVSFFADPPADAGVEEQLSAATTVLEMALRDILREELGQTYTVRVGSSQSLPQRGNGHVAVSFGAAPENVDAMIDRVLQEVKRLQQEGPSADLTSRAKESARRGHEVSLTQNAYWLRRLQSAHLAGLDPAEILKRADRIDAVTPAGVQEMFRKYFPLDRYTVVTLVPAEATARPGTPGI